jgi:hypothetical protein
MCLERITISKNGLEVCISRPFSTCAVIQIFYKFPSAKKGKSPVPATLKIYVFTERNIEQLVSRVYPLSLC